MVLPVGRQIPFDCVLMVNVSLHLNGRQWDDGEEGKDEGVEWAGDSKMLNTR